MIKNIVVTPNHCSRKTFRSVQVRSPILDISAVALAFVATGIAGVGMQGLVLLS